MNGSANDYSIDGHANVAEFAKNSDRPEGGGGRDISGAKCASGLPAKLPAQKRGASPQIQDGANLNRVCFYGVKHAEGKTPGEHAKLAPFFTMCAAV